MELASLKAGTSVEFMSRLEGVAKTAGVGIDALVNGFKILEQRAELAAEGNEAAIKGFQRLGISVAQAKSLMEEPEKFFQTIKDRIGAIEDPALRTAAALGVMGRGGFNLVPLLSQSNEETKKLQDTIESLGGTVTREQAEWGHKWGQMEGIVSAAWEGIKKTVADPILEWVAKNFDDIVDSVKQTAMEIRDVLAPAIQGLIPHMGEFLHGIESLALGVANAFAMALKFAELFMSILRVVTDAVRGVMELVTGIDMSGEFVGENDYKRMDGSRGGPNNSAPSITVNAKFEAMDPHKASSAIAEQLRPHLIEAERRSKEQMKDAVHRKNINATLRGGR
jgi:hypothetical protein